MANPMSTSAHALCRLLLNMSGNAMPIKGSDSTEILTLNPKSVMIQTVIVVPILAPRITPTDFANFAKGSNPAFTKLTTDAKNQQLWPPYFWMSA